MALNVWLTIQERRRDLSYHLSTGIAKHHFGNEKKQICLRRICSSTGVGRLHTKHTQETHLVLSSFRFEIGDFVDKDESGNALWASWLRPVFDGTLHETWQRYEVKFKRTKKMKEKRSNTFFSCMSRNKERDAPRRCAPSNFNVTVPT